MTDELYDKLVLAKWNLETAGEDYQAERDALDVVEGECTAAGWANNFEDTVQMVRAARRLAERLAYAHWPRRPPTGYDDRSWGAACANHLLGWERKVFEAFQFTDKQIEAASGH